MSTQVKGKENLMVVKNNLKGRETYEWLIPRNSYFVMFHVNIYSYSLGMATVWNLILCPVPIICVCPLSWCLFEVIRYPNLPWCCGLEAHSLLMTSMKCSGSSIWFLLCLPALLANCYFWKLNWKINMDYITLNLAFMVVKSVEW